VYFSAYGFGGKPARLLASVISGEHVIITSPALLAEVADELYTVLGFDDVHVAEVIRQLARIAEVVRPTTSVHVIADEADNRVLECAAEGAADTIVSGDRHLLDLGDYEGIRVVRVAEFLAQP
jgi:putative PIN family toxin of toxin-antitoxin system